MTSRTRDIAFACAMLAINILIWMESLKPQYSDAQAQDYGFTPAFFPQILLSIWALLCVVLIVRSLVLARTEHAAPLWGRLFSAFLITGAYIFLVDQVGFLLASIPFAAGFMFIFGYRNPVVMAAVALVFPVATWWVFTHLLQIVLPTSPWFTSF